MFGEESATDPKNVVNSVLRACQMLEVFSHDRPALTLGELADAADMKKTTAHRILASLVQAGWVSQRPDGAYKINMRLFSVGSVALAELNLRDEARPLLRRLSEQFGDTAYLMVPSVDGAVCIDIVEGASPLTIKSIAVGSVLPYHVAAGPLTILAYSAELRSRWLSRPLEEFTAHTVADSDVLQDQLDKIISEGYTVSDQDFLEGVGAVAAPVFGPSGDVPATVSLGGPAAHFRGSNLVGVIAAVRDAGERLTRQLGGNSAPSETALQ